MSGVMIKTGIYGILRVLLLIGTPSKEISYFVLSIALVTVLYGVLYAITQHDIKRLLAYSSIENIGIIGIGIGVGMLGLAYSNPVVATFGFAGGLLHILNHSIFKELMFFAAGSTYLKTHTRKSCQPAIAGHGLIVISHGYESTSGNRKMSAKICSGRTSDIYLTVVQ
jgi:formate hydrogenlyase subunit 3/multisubunit Na+/H+ antiporter MnhD subunit